MRNRHLVPWRLARECFCVKLSLQMQRMVGEQRLGFVATVTPDGRPNLSPKGTTRLWDDERLFLADIASPRTIARKGFRFKGVATVHTGGDIYDRGLEKMRAQGSTTSPERVRSIVVIDVTEDYHTELHHRDDRRPHAAGHT